MVLVTFLFSGSVATLLTDGRLCQLKMSFQNMWSAPEEFLRAVFLVRSYFVLYTSQMSSILPAAVFHQEFVDDIIVDFSHCNPAAVCSALTDAVTCLSEWLTSIGLLLNASKTQVMFIRPRGCVASPSEVRCGTPLLDTTNVSKYVWFSATQVMPTHYQF